MNTARKAEAAGLVSEGYLTSSASHSGRDVGAPLIEFTAKAKPFLLETSDTLKSMDIQRVRIAEEVVDDIEQVQYTSDGNTARVVFTTVLENATPFAAMFNRAAGSVVTRETTFVKSNATWQWTGKIRSVKRN